MHEISLNSSAIARILGSVAILLVLASIGGQFANYVLGYGHVMGMTFLNVDEERNLPTFFSVLLIFFATLLLAVIAVLNWKEKNPDTSKWAILSIGFLVMAFDEAFELHERLIKPVRGLLGNSDLGVFYFAWVIPGFVLVLVLGLFFLKFLLRLPAKPRFRFLIAATLYVGGALGVEFPEGYYADLHGEQNMTYNMIATVQESLEMAGLVVFIWALLKYCADNFKEVRFRFEA